MLEVGTCVRMSVGKVGDDVKGSPRYPAEVSRFSVSVVGPGVGPYVGLLVGPRVRMSEVGTCVRVTVGEVGDDGKGSPRYPGL